MIPLRTDSHVAPTRQWLAVLLAVVVASCTVPGGLCNLGDHADSAYIALIKTAAEKIAEDRFEGDPTVSQSVDRMNSKTYYKQMDEQGTVSATTVLENNAVDSGKSVIVIPGADEKSKRYRKGSFVVLRQKPGEKKTYYVTNAYVRKSLDNDSPGEKHVLGGDSVVIEWSPWRTEDAHMSQGRSWRTDDYFDSSEVKSSSPITDIGRGVNKADVKDLKWGLNVHAVGSVGASEFTASLKGKASWGQMAHVDGLAMAMVGEALGLDGDFDFFADLDGAPDGRTVSDAKSDLADAAADLSVVLDNDAAFVGFGHCPYVKQTAGDIEGISDPISAVMVYLTALRQHCVKRERSRALKLFKAGHLTINGDKSLSIPADCPLLKTAKLRRSESLALALAFELSMMSQVYAAEMRSPSAELVAPDGTKIPRPVHTVIRFALHALQNLKDHMPAHLIMITRSLVQMLRAINAKVLRHYEKVKTCGCPEKDQAAAGIVNLQAIQQFIINNFNAVVRQGDIIAAYDIFYNVQKDSFTSNAKQFL